MYNLGMVCREVWQDGTIPQDILDVILTRPASGIGLISKFIAKADQDIITDLMDRIPDIVDPPGGVKNEDQGPFWLGFYHFIKTREWTKKFGAAELESVGKALYGDRWQSDLSRGLGVDSRRVRQWMSGDRPIPVGVWADIAGFLRKRQTDIKSILNDLTTDKL